MNEHVPMQSPEHTAWQEELAILREKFAWSAEVEQPLVGSIVVSPETHDTAIGDVLDTIPEGESTDVAVCSSDPDEALAQLQKHMNSDIHSWHDRNYALIDLSGIPLGADDPSTAAIGMTINMGRTRLHDAAKATFIVVDEADKQLLAQLPDIFSTRAFMIDGEKIE